MQNIKPSPIPRIPIKLALLILIPKRLNQPLDFSLIRRDQPRLLLRLALGTLSPDPRAVL